MDALFLVLFIFGGTGIAIWALLNFSRERCGTNAPLKIARTYETTAWEYFLRLDNLIMMPFPLLTLFFLPRIFTMEVRAENEPAWLVYLIMIFLLIMLFLLSAYYITLLLNYWQFTKDVSITTNPKDHSLFINIQGRNLLIQAGDIEKVRLVANNSRIYFSYSKYYLKNGDTFMLTDRMPGIWAIADYFKKIPVELEYQLFPFIK